MDGKEYYQFLLTRYLSGLATEPEQEELFSELQRVRDDEEWEKLLQEQLMRHQQTVEYDEAKWEPVIQKILKAGEQQQGRVRTMRSWMKIAAAAVFISILSTVLFLSINKLKTNGSEIAKAHKTPVQNDISSGGDRAILTLADGRKIVLDTASNGALAQQGNIKVIKIGGQLSYNTEGTSSEVLYNTITTPKGGQYQLALADGSKVWLNAASSLRFPTAFSGKERTVELTGEGYFEVAHNAKMPFHVKVNEMDVQVLGTHFNINSYSDEPSVKTTLLEGRVMVKKKNQLVYLNPGQQAVLHQGQDDIRVNYNVDVEEVVAWKNGRFLFNRSDIGAVMRQIARWYDVEVVYEKNTNETISGGLPRSQNVSQLLKILEATGKVDFEINGKEIIVKPK